jgi:hypothetical protein
VVFVFFSPLRSDFRAGLSGLEKQWNLERTEMKEI